MADSLHLATSLTNISASSSVHHIAVSNSSTIPITSDLTHSARFQQQQQTQQQQRQHLTQTLNSNQTTTLSGLQETTINTIKPMTSLQGQTVQSINSPGSPFSVQLKSPASSVAPPTPSPSPNRILLRSPAGNSLQSRNSPSPVSLQANNFGMQLQSPMQSPMSVGQIQSPALSPYPPAKSPHLSMGSNSSMNNRSPAPGGSPGPPVVSVAQFFFFNSKAFFLFFIKTI